MTVNTNNEKIFTEAENYNSEELEHELIARVMIAILAKGQGPK